MDILNRRTKDQVSIFLGIFGKPGVAGYVTANAGSVRCSKILKSAVLHMWWNRDHRNIWGLGLLKI